MNQDFTLEDILEEQRIAREQAGAPPEPAGSQDAPPGPPSDGPSAEYEYTEEPAPPEPAPQEPVYQEAAPRPMQSLQTAQPLQTTQPLQPTQSAPPQPEYPQPEDEPPSKSSKKKKKSWWPFGRRKKVPDFDENEEDMYYGIQLKPIDEYRLDGDAPPLGEEGYKALFDDSQSIDDEVEENFQRLQKERRRRVAEAVKSAGLDEEKVADEFGVAAPMPVTSFAADPYARQHGLEVEGRQDPSLSQLQKAMLETSSETMEIKLNVLNSTIELQRVREGQIVSDETVDRILAAAPPQPPEQAYPAYEEVPPQPEESQPVYQEVPPEPQGIAPPPAQSAAVYQEEPSPETAEEPGHPEYVEQPNLVQQAAGQTQPAAEFENYPQDEPRQETAGQAKTVVMPTVAPGGEAQPAPAPPTPQPPAAVEPPPRPTQQIPYVDSIFQYRSRNIPTHIIHADVLQSALLSEAEPLQLVRQAEEAKHPRWIKPKTAPVEEEEAEAPPPPENVGESIDDYTGPEDARSISNDLRGDMQGLSLRLMITGICTVLLALVGLICQSRFSLETGSGSWPLAYVVLTLVFIVVSAGMCYKTIGGGLGALFAAKANSDSAAAVAALAAIIQAVTSVFFQEDLVTGGLHLYAVVASGILFLNTAGKLTMIRRIHSNFRFVTSREEKFAVRTYDDYNTSLKMVKDCVAEKPLVAYQCRAGFLKRFLELSHTPDPSETSSQTLAPLGLICSLALCVACLLITSSVPTAISAFAASCCACVAAANMLSVNLPVSRMCKRARRAGGMAVGYEAAERFGDVNAVIADAGELFPTGTVVLSGIKTFGAKSAAEDAIMAASALVKEIGGPLSGVFDQVISENEEALPQVEKFSYESGGGIVGRVDGRTIYIGLRGLLINHRLEVPTREEETQYASGNRNIIYIASDADVAAMLVLSYTADRRKKNELQRLEDSGISILVRTTDPNVNTALVARLFGIDPSSVGILDAQLGDTASRLLEETQPRADATAATKGRMESMMSLISACVDLKRTTGVLVAIQTAAVILGFVFVAALACFGAMNQLSAFILFLFQLFWVGILLLLPKLRR